ncbi:lipopolysaccharide heptosyltransferase I [Acidithiobacillus sulfuriphilus]|uniref:Lipopolysaccharide heptosyltransferase 1 n=2 Tax=Acidithiobacillus sulfuriphilus TaxID=1867749 RepID=A0A3M8QP30_9PROT|nr:lipopolysaccharide heptosyltransferase I [Acidithiobacillus sulfuriphilus]RNF57898.1 lipopolysaccharide heptosyltransferase I [Acidithiobacillus sulfuriphilus]
MKLLLVRLSSLGDVLHTFPALSDLQQQRPDVAVHWLVEPAFAELAAWHPGVQRVIPFGLRRLRGDWGQLGRAMLALRRQLQEAGFDAVLDAQGLYKSAVLARLAAAPVLGLHRHSAREGGATLLYHRRHAVPWDQPAIQRNRQLFAQALGYGLDDLPIDYGLTPTRMRLRDAPLDYPWRDLAAEPFILGFHGTTWANKEWTPAHWLEMAQILAGHGYRLLLPAGNAAERRRATALAAQAGNVHALPPTTLAELAALMVRACAFIGVDTGLSYLAAALGLPGTTLYGPTASEQVAAIGTPQISVQSPLACSPCRRSRCPLPPTAEGDIPCQGALQPAALWPILAAHLDSRTRPEP